MKLCLLAALVFCTLPASSQQVPRDTTAVASDSLARKFIKPIPFVGTLDRFLPEGSSLTDSMINFQDYRSSGDFLSRFPGVYTGDFGGAGQLNNITIEGEGNREVAYMADGILLNDPLTGLFNPWLYPTENIDRVEVVRGTSAFLYGINSTGGTVNFVSKSKKAIHPYSRIRYTESAYGLSIIDGMLSQDIIRGLNVTAGAQHATYGERFPNDSYDCWTGRLKIRYNISGALNIFASELYNQTELGLNGGIDIENTAQSLWFDRLQARLHNTDAYEKVTRHDLRLGVAGRFLPDTEAVSMLTFYLSSSVREYRDEENRPNPNGIFLQEDQRSEWTGVKLTQEIPWGEHRLNLGAEFQGQRALVTPQTQDRRATVFNVYGKGDFRLGGPLLISPYARWDSRDGMQKVSYGGDASLELNPCTHAFGGYSRSFRFPVMQETPGMFPELSPTLGTETPERHDLCETGVRWGSGDQQLELKAFQRIIRDAIGIRLDHDVAGTPLYGFESAGRRVLRGIDGSLKWRIGSFVVEGSGQFLEEKNNGELQSTNPRWTGTGGVYFWDKLFEGHLNLKAGFRGRVFSPFNGMVFDQHLMVYLPDSSQTSIAASGTADFVIIARLGNAYLHFIWDNLLDRQYVMENFYPMPARQIRFGVSWDFTD
jgi:outer membrane cobalamin receptor